MRTIRDIYRQFNEQPKRTRRHVIGVASFGINYVWALMKFVLGLVQMSFFFLLSGIYSACLGLARNTVTDGIRQCNKNIAKQREFFAKIILVLLGATVVFEAYMVRLFFIPTDFYWHPTVAVFSILMAVFELAMSVYGIRTSQKENDLLIMANTAININGLLSAIMLAVVSIITLTLKAKTSYFYIAICGGVFGALGFIVCGVMLVIYKKSGDYVRKLQSMDGKDTNFFR